MGAVVKCELPFLKRKGGDPEITAFSMSVTSLSTNPFYLGRPGSEAE
jgi:hypothetical protein